MSAQDFSDLIFEIKQKITDDEYKRLMEMTGEIFKKQKCQFYEITHLDPRIEYTDYGDDDEEDEEYYKIKLVHTKTILRLGDEYTEKVLDDIIPNELSKHGYCEVEKAEIGPDLLNNTMDDQIKSPYYHVIAIKPCV